MVDVILCIALYSLVFGDIVVYVLLLLLFAYLIFGIFFRGR